jgi:hypothetical protein
MYTTLVLFLVYLFICEVVVISFQWPHTNKFAAQLRTTKHRERDSSRNILMSLILLLFFFRTGQVVAEWYYVWLGFIKHGGTSDEVLLSLNQGFASEARGPVTTTNVLTTLKLAIADGIIVGGSPHSSILELGQVILILCIRFGGAGSSGREVGEQFLFHLYSISSPEVR